MEPLKYVGQRIPEIYAWAKVTGEAPFTDDLRLPGMLFGKILRSPHAHARIRSINASRALELPGVVTVMTGADTPGIKYVAQISDMYPLAIDKVRYVGDSVVAVAAETEEIAQEALALIEVEYEPLPAVFDPCEALLDGAPLIHEDRINNLVLNMKRDFGNVDEGFAQSDRVFEDQFSTQAVSHCNMEPRSSAAWMNPDGVLQIWTGTQSPYFVRKEVAHVCDLPISSVQVMEVHCGGGFGSRSKYCEDEGVTALLAIRCGRPVRITFTREEEMTTTRIRHPFFMRIKTGVKLDGTLMAREMQVIVDKGAYCHYGPAITGYAAGTAASSYRIPHFRFNADIVYTNKQAGGPFRGFGAPQVIFAIESQLDEIAEALGIDPLELRIKNANRSGDLTPCGWAITTCGLEECLEKVSQAINWKERRKEPKDGRYRKGKGLATAIHVSGSNVFPDGEFSAIELKMFIDGRVSVYKGSGDTGTWANTVITQIVAEELQLPMESIRLISMDTETTPQSLGSFASRVAFEDGNAAKMAAAQLKTFLLESAAVVLEVPMKTLFLQDGMILCREDPSKTLSYGDSVFHSPRTVGHILTSAYQYVPPTVRLTPKGYANVSAAYAFSAQGAEVVVDTQTGEIRVKRLVVAQDVGKALNPIAVEGQIEGALAQGMGYALTEELKVDPMSGKVVTDCLDRVMLPTAMDIPDEDIFLVETLDPEGPYGAKGVGEIGLNPTAAAIANAIYDAVGFRPHKLPIKAEEVYFFLHPEKR
ncbi:MAG: molybdopterin cofactor-binding domain-containing protein [bacterium]